MQTSTPTSVPPPSTDASSQPRSARTPTMPSPSAPQSPSGAAPSLLADSANDCSRHLFLLHTPIRVATARLHKTVNDLTPLAPDAHLDNVQRRLKHLSNTFLSHCGIEDKTIVPWLRMALQSQNGLPSSSSYPQSIGRWTSSSPPAKRPRVGNTSGTVSPISVALSAISDDHSVISLAFSDLRKALAGVRAASLLRADDIVTSRPDKLAAARSAAARLSEVVTAHLKEEEETFLPACSVYLQEAQRVDLLLHVTSAVVSNSHLVATMRHVAHDELVGLFKTLSDKISHSQLRSIAGPIAHVLPERKWASLCISIPVLTQLVRLRRNPLTGIRHMHLAITKELSDIVSYCESLDLKHPKQMQTLSHRFEFLRRVHAFHSRGENDVLMQELSGKLESLGQSGIDRLTAEHDDEDAFFSAFADRRAAIEKKARLLPDGSKELSAQKHGLVESVRELADRLKAHMADEENKLLPQMRQHFSLAEQDRLMRNVSAMMPPDMMKEIVPWMFNSLEVNNREEMLRNLSCSTPPEEFQALVGLIAQSVRNGMTDRVEWHEICLRIPEIETIYESIGDRDDEDDVGPVSEILRIHKAFRIELNGIMRQSKRLLADGTFPNPHALVSLAERLAFLQKMVEDHSNAEDEIILPKLEERVPGISTKYKDDHIDERQLFRDISSCLQELQCVSEESTCAALVSRLHALTTTMRDEMVSHLRLEEEHMWPKLKSNFSTEEQSEIVALIFGQMSSHRLRELLPWMIRTLSVTEGSIMMNHILQVTRSTLFEKWLKTWLLMDDEVTERREKVATESADGADRVSPAARDAPHPSSTTKQLAEGSTTAMVLLNSRTNVEQTIRAIARDSSLSVEERTRMMQHVMLAPYGHGRSGCTSDVGGENQVLDDRSKTYALVDNKRVLGCKHYQRACKLRAACCGKLYTCRLCHDDAEQTHIMDRYSTKEILCMVCETLQPVSNQCVNEKCQMTFARYFCEVCVFYDNNDKRSIYHCHSCNVCRAGQGLGKDFFHCMKCNQCMSMKYRKGGHVCIENAMESDCPVCRQFLFLSTRPIKHLNCGHLMHSSCYAQHVARNLRCPVCSRSLQETKPMFKQIDEQLAAGGPMSMPEEYSRARCWIACMDCQERSFVKYHFLYNKCPSCDSYNTRVDRIDANAGDLVG